MREIDEVQSQNCSKSFKPFFNNIHLFFNYSFMFIESNHPKNYNCLMNSKT